MIIEVKAPEAGESIVEGFIVEWFKADGDFVTEDESLFEFETDKITMAVPSPAAGRLSIVIPADSTVKVGEVVGRIDTEAAEQPAAASAQPAASPAAPPQSEMKRAEPEQPAPVSPPIAPPAGAPQAQAKLSDGVDPDELSPAVRRLVAEHQLDPASIRGSGKDGRLTKEDVLAHLQKASAPKAPAPAPTPAAAPARPANPAPPVSAAPAQDAPRQTRKRMSALRQRIAERLIQSQQTTASLTTFNEVDMSALMALRDKWKDAFEKKHGVRLGFMSFFTKAVVDALKTYPQVNTQIDGDELVQNHFYDIGVAIGSDKGLIVPILRDVDKMGFADIEAKIGDFSQKVRNNKLDLKDLQGGCFTISNGGVYGSLMSTPILNPPQSAILGMHATKKRPVVVNDEIVIRPMMYLALTYDHRVIDGKDAVTFLKRIVEVLEHPERLLLEV